MRQAEAFSKWLHLGWPLARVLAMILALAFSLRGSGLLAADGDVSPAIAQESDVRPAEQPEALSATEGEIESRGVLPMQRQRPTEIGVLPAPPIRLERVPQLWETLWSEVWRLMVRVGPIEVASPVAQVPICQGNLGLDVLVHDTILATTLRKYGDAERFMGQFQDRMACLTNEGVRQVEMVLALFLGSALELLPPDQISRIASPLFNLNLLVFDQVQYTRFSLWQLGIAPRAKQMSQLLQTSESLHETGLWLHDFDRSLLVQQLEPGLYNQILQALVESARLGDGRCTLLEMAETSRKTSSGFQCPRQRQGSASGSHPGSGAVAGGGSSLGAASCLLESASVSGMRGQLICARRAAAGMRLTFEQAVNEGPTSNPAVFDKQCVVGKESKAFPSNLEDPLKRAMEQCKGMTPEQCAQLDFSGIGADPEFLADLEKIRERLRVAQAEVLKSQKETEDAANRAKNSGQETQALADAQKKRMEANTFLAKLAKSLEAKTAEVQQRAKQGQPASTSSPKPTPSPAPPPSANAPCSPTPGQPLDSACPQPPPPSPLPKTGQERPMGDTGTGPFGAGGVCDKRSNAARRAAAMYQCFAAQDPLQSGPGGRRIIVTPKPLDPTRAFVDPGQQMVKMSAPLACAVQGGDLPRMSMNDPQCVAVRCMEGQVCPCNKSTLLGGNQMQPLPIRPSGGATPDCIGDGPCGVKPSLPGGISPLPPGPGPK